MSAAVIPFPCNVTSQATSLLYSCEIIKSEKRGFADVDACVPPSFATKFMNLIAHCEDAKLNFLSQIDSGGMVLIDACVPEKLAADFRGYFPTAA